MSKICEVKNLRDLANLLSLKLQNLTYLLYKKKPENYYTTFYRLKKNGDQREINAPNGLLLHVQKLLCYEFTELYIEVMKNNNVAHAFIKERSIFTNVRKHKNKKFIIHLDLEDFFSSFHYGRVKGFFEKNKLFNYDDNFAAQMANLLCYNGKLPQGAPTSPIVTNFICQIMDYKILGIINKYRLNYSRYADDLIFSTNDRKIVELFDEFYDELKLIIEKSGFAINENKTNFSNVSNRHLVTGLVINKKINCPIEFYKQTRAMAHKYYKTNKAYQDGVEISPNVIEGRFSFIKQAILANEVNGKDISSNKRINVNNNKRLNEYKKFLFYRKFYNLEKPLIITEGPTDILYIKAALRKYKDDYPTLISDDNGEITYKFDFMKRNKSSCDIFGLSRDGADTITSFITSNFDHSLSKDKLKLYNYFYSLTDKVPQYPIIAIYDSEFNDKHKPIYKLCKYMNAPKVKNNDKIYQKFNYLNFNKSNVYVLPIPNNTNKDIEIEDLLPEDSKVINDFKFDRNNPNLENKTFGKKHLARYIYTNYKEVDLENFKPLLNLIVVIIDDYNKQLNK